MYPCNSIKDNYNVSEGIELVYEQLFDHYGPQNWWPADSSIEVIIGAILTQAVNWSNVEKAISNLKEANLVSLKKLKEVKENRLAELIKPSGYYNMKAKKLKSFVSYIDDNYDLNLNKFTKGKPETIRKKLLDIYGIGPETADSIMLYAFNQPKFVIDTYTKRIISRIGYTSEDVSYDKLKALFEKNLENDSKLFNEYHALLVKHAKEHCLKSSPLCIKCPLNKTI
ncbi:MAG: endonuclease III domain-containing protein [Halanaerobiales bacterium]|nr:endonuclease III domain-containing protein [Halanaerobiales bacterium]